MTERATLDPAVGLRQWAEEKAKGYKAEIREALSPEDARQVLHELRVHQIELEVQNEELRRAQAELEASRARYFDLYDLAPVGYFTVSEQGLILEANLTAAGLLGVPRAALVNKPLTRFIVRGDQDIYFPKESYEEMAGLIKGSRLKMYAGKGHMNTMQGKVFVKDMFDFIGRGR